MGQTILEINGRKYDAATGRILDNSSPVQTKNSGHNIDGIVAQNQPARPAVDLAPKTRPKPTLSSPKRLMHDVTNSNRTKLQRSKTLMRKTVKKPVSVHKNQHQTVSASVSNQSRHAAIQSDKRLQSALQTPTHTAVRRFNSHASPTATKPALANMPVVSEPRHSQPAAAPKIQPKKTELHNFVDRQLAKADSASKESPFKKPRLSKRVKSRLVSNKLVSASAIGLSVLLIGGFLVMQNLPGLSFALATQKSGLSASLPHGIPSNFQMDRRISYSPGQITVAYKSRTDDRLFDITLQKSTDATVESLESAISNNTSGEYQTYKSGGLTLFITAPGRADWIDGDMRYSLSGNSGLSSEQLAAIATSM